MVALNSIGGSLMTTRVNNKRFVWLLATAATCSLLAGGPCAAAPDVVAASTQTADQVGSNTAAKESNNKKKEQARSERPIVVAQNTAPQTPTTSSSAQSTVNPSQGPEQVMVTADKRSEALLSVPTPVTAVQAADLERRVDSSISDYAASVPGLNLISSEPGQTVVIMRGISTGFGASIPSTTATYIDDAPYGSSTANAYGSIGTIDLDPATLERVEVLRGPQGTLYGASSMGGLIKYVTKPPSLTDYSARMEAGTSSIDGGGQGYEMRAMFDGPLIDDKLGFTISGFDRLDPGFISDPHRGLKNVNHSQGDGGRLALLWKPTSNFSAELSVLIQDTFTPNTSEVDLNTNLTPIYGKYQQVRYGNEDWDFRNRQYSLNMDYDLGWADLTSITSFANRIAKWNIDESVKFGPTVTNAVSTFYANPNVPNLGLFDNVTLDHNKTTQEFRLTSPDNQQLEWLAGFFFTHEQSVKPEAFGQPISLATDQPLPQFAVPGGLFTDILHDSYTEYAGYADLTYHITSSFKVLGGVRFTSDSENSITPFSGLLNGPSTTVVGNAASQTVTYLFSPSYNFDDLDMVYARVATGFRPGGPTGVAATSVLQGAPESYGPDSLTSYEVGYKASYPEWGMTLDASAFDIEWKNIQLLTEINGFFVTGNGAKARSAGAEIAWTWQPLTGLNIAANAGYTDAYLTTDAPQVGGKAGNNLPDVPRFSANLSGDYDFQITNKVGGFVGGNVDYMGKRHIDFVSGTPVGYAAPTMGGYSTVNIRAGVTKEGVTVEAYIKNLADAYGLTRLRSEVKDGYDGPLTASVIQPRTYGLTISDNF